MDNYIRVVGSPRENLSKSHPEILASSALAFANAHTTSPQVLQIYPGSLSTLHAHQIQVIQKSWVQKSFSSGSLSDTDERCWCLQSSGFYLVQSCLAWSGSPTSPPHGEFTKWVQSTGQHSISILWLSMLSRDNMTYLYQELLLESGSIFYFLLWIMELDALLQLDALVKSTSW